MGIDEEAEESPLHKLPLNVCLLTSGLRAENNTEPLLYLSSLNENGSIEM